MNYRAEKNQPRSGQRAFKESLDHAIKMGVSARIKYGTNGYGVKPNNSRSKPSSQISRRCLDRKYMCWMSRLSDLSGCSGFSCVLSQQPQRRAAV